MSQCTCLGDIFDVRCPYHAWEIKRAESKAFRPQVELPEFRSWIFGYLPTTRGKTGQARRESHARRQIAQASTAAAIAHFMGVYATTIEGAQ